MKKVLVTGGTGYIGSHTVIELIQLGYEVVIIDNLSNSKIDILDKIETITGTRPHFEEIEMCDALALDTFFERNKRIFIII
jgi:UDP-glucose 4-epimerase